MIPPPQAFWVEGHTIFPTATQDNNGQEQLVTPRVGEYSILKQRGVEAEKDVERRHFSETGGATTKIRVSQKPSSALPPSRKAHATQSGVVQTFVMNRADSIHVTLYLDSLVSESSLRSANVEIIGNDSLILHLPNQRIGLRLPSALVDQVKSKTNR
jgi:hypothetical protein